MRINTIFEQGTSELNEDCHLVRDNLFGVFDGATSLSPARYDDGLTGGYLASNTAGKVFGQNDDSLEGLAAKANSAIRQEMMARGVDLSDKGNLWSASGAVVRLFEDRFEWAQLGDSLILVIFGDHSFEVIPRRFNHDLETLTLWKEKCRSTDQCIAQAMRDQIFKIRSRMNIDYGVFSGEPEAMDFLRTGVRPLKNISHILLFTDGLFLPKADPSHREDFEAFTCLFLEGGLQRVRDYVRQVEATDPGCREYPRFKTHDDIAATSISF